MTRQRLLLAAVCAVLSVLLAAPARAVVSIAPELEAQLREKGAYWQVVTQLQAAREKGWFEMEDPYAAEGASKSVGKARTWRAIVLLVDFADYPASGSYNAPEFDDMIFSEGSFPTGSMRDFYLENSHGEFQLTGDVVGWLRMPQPLSYYCNQDGLAGTSDDFGFGGYPNNARKLYEDAVSTADPLVNFSHYTNGFSGVRGVFVVHAGPGAETTGNASHIWSHQSSGSFNTSDGVATLTYIFMPELQFGGMSTVGVFCHEFGHVLGLPDLYDIDGSSQGIGRWGLMGGGSWNGGGTRPAHYTAWAKQELGFTVPIEPSQNEIGYLLSPVIDTNTVLKIQTPEHAPSEYLMVENRRQQGFDDALPNEGLIVYHVDDAMNNNASETCEGAAASHPIVRVIQADGLCQLEADLGAGAAGDVFPGTAGVTDLGAKTIPSTRAYSGSKSGVRLSNIALVGSDVQFDLQLDEVLLALVTEDVATLGDALALAGNGDEVRLPAGHVTTGNFTVNGGVRISGGWDASFSTQDPAQPSVIEGGQAAKSVLGARSGHLPLQLDNLVVRNGKGVKIYDPEAEWRGGGVEARDVQAVLTRVRFENNRAGNVDGTPSFGGALALENSDFTLEDCSFAGNTALEGGAIWSSSGSLTLRRTAFEGSSLQTPLVASIQRGGAILAFETTLVLEDCTIEGYGGATHGGAIHATGITPLQATNLEVASCSASQEGGGMWLQVGDVEFRGLELRDNIAVSGGAGLLMTGGALDWGGGEVRGNSGVLLGAGVKVDGLLAGSRIAGVAFVGNAASVVGGAMMVSGGALALDHLTLAANQGGGALISGATTRLESSIVAGNTGAGVTFASATVTSLDHNLWFANSGGDVSGVAKGASDLDADPLFVSVEDVHLGVGSPAIDGAAAGGHPDFDGSLPDRGAYGGEFDRGDRPGALTSVGLSEPLPGDFRLQWEAPAADPLATAAQQVAIFGEVVSEKAASAGLPWLHTAAIADGQWVHGGVGTDVSVRYQLQAVDAAGRAGSYTVELNDQPVAAPSAPAAFRVGPATPNPFNPTTRVQFELPRSGRVQATVYDLAGRRVATLLDGPRPAGTHTLVWTGQDDQGRGVASGVYLLRVVASDGHFTRRLALVK